MNKKKLKRENIGGWFEKILLKFLYDEVALKKKKNVKSIVNVRPLIIIAILSTLRRKMERSCR